MALAQEDLAVVGWLLAADAGHDDCGGWFVDSRAGALVCACGARLFELVNVAGGAR
jgi:hypothetical protein